MPLREGGYRRMEDLPRSERHAYETRPFQAHWYELIASRLRPEDSVLDVGAGVGYGLDILRTRRPAPLSASVALGIDLVSLRLDVWLLPVSAFASGSFSVVTAVDVIEHVEDDGAFLEELLRVASGAVFLSTPNWDVSRAENPFHVREYTPDEFLALLPSPGFYSRTDLFASGEPPPVATPVPDLRACVPSPRNFGAWIWK